MWGPDKIAYARYSRPKGKRRKEDGPKYNLHTLNPDGSGHRALTRDKVPFLLPGS